MPVRLHEANLCTSGSNLVHFWAAVCFVFRLFVLLLFVLGLVLCGVVQQQGQSHQSLKTQAPCQGAADGIPHTTTTDPEFDIVNCKCLNLGGHPPATWARKLTHVGCIQKPLHLTALASATLDRQIAQRRCGSIIFERRGARKHRASRSIA